MTIVKKTKFLPLVHNWFVIIVILLTFCSKMTILVNLITVQKVSKFTIISSTTFNILCFSSPLVFTLIAFRKVLAILPNRVSIKFNHNSCFGV